MSREVAILREVVRKLVPLLSSKGIKVTQMGSQAYVKANERTHVPEVVNIPNIPDNADAAFVLAIQGFIDHEIGHVLFTNFEEVRKAITDGMAIARSRGENPALGGERLRNLGNIVEDVFVERSMRGKFPGAEWNLEKLYDVFLRRITKPAFEKAKDDKEKFSVLLVPLVRAWGGQKRFQEFLDINGYSDLPLIKAFNEVVPDKIKKKVATAKNSTETHQIARELFNILYPPPPPPEEKESEDEGDGASGSSGKKSEEEKDEGSGSSEEKDKSDSSDKKGEKEKDEGDGAESEAAGDEESAGESGEKEADDDAASEADEDDVGSSDDEGAESAGAKSEDKKGDDGADGEEQSSEDSEADGSESGSGADADDEADEEDEGETSAGASEDNAGDDGESGKDEPEKNDGSVGEPEDGAGHDETVSRAGGESSESPDEEGDEEEGEEVSRDESEDFHPEYDKDDIAGEEKGEEGEGRSGEGSQRFPSLEPDLNNRDLAAAIAKEITDQATRETRDADYRVFTTDWDKIEPLQVDPDLRDLAKTMEELDDKTRHMIAPMQKEIERMMAARSQIIHVPGFRSGRLHGGSLHRLRVNDDRVFRRRHEHKSKETAVSLLIDNSGSMSGYSWSTKLPIAMASGYALSQTLERVNIKHEVLGFTTLKQTGEHRRLIDAEALRIGKNFSRMEALYMPIFKGFDERLGTEQRRRFAGAIAGEIELRNNIDGESVRIATRRLLARPEQRRVLLVFSDGNPACHTLDDAEIYADLHRAVKEAEQAKVEVIGIGILSRAVETFYPKHIVLNELDKLPSTVMGELKRILVSSYPAAA